LVVGLLPRKALLLMIIVL